MKLLSFLRSLNNPRTPLADYFEGPRSATGLAITPENSLELTPIWAAVRMISSTLATLPLPVYRRTNEGKERAPEHPVYRLLHDRPNPEMSSFVWRELTMAHLLLWGGAFSEIERNGRGDPINLWPLHPSNVRVQRVGSERLYVVRVNGQEVALNPENVLHIPGFSLDGCNGLVPATVARNAIALGKAAEQYGASFFQNGTAPSGILTHPGKLGIEGEEGLRKSWNKQHQGLTNSQRVAILQEGITWTPLAVPPETAQFLETRKFSVAEIARIFLLPPHLIGDLAHATFSNIESQQIQYVTHCIEPWTRRIEQEINYKLFSDSSHYAEFVLEGLLRGDSKARAEFYASALNNGWLSVNEVRSRENLNRIPEGDTHLRPLNMAPLE